MPCLLQLSLCFTHMINSREPSGQLPAGQQVSDLTVSTSRPGLELGVAVEVFARNFMATLDAAVPHQLTVRYFVLYATSNAGPWCWSQHC